MTYGTLNTSVRAKRVVYELGETRKWVESSQVHTSDTHLRAATTYDVV
jgi:hypothetical protein